LTVHSLFRAQLGRDALTARIRAVQHDVDRLLEEIAEVVAAF